ncbi:UNVERIFIED_CONTAM: hypothetical protein GTU68_033488, partial [Idotea baltica]|nr:hypothetical protein [Idotea baltica]
NYPRQSKEPFSLHYEIAPAAFDKGRYLLLLGVNARSAVEERKPWNLTFLVDVSGSMQGEDRLGLVKRSLKYLVEQMGKEDKVSIVTYAGSASLALDGSGMEQKNKILQAIENLQSGGSTHGSAGIALAYNVNSKHSISEGVNRVILATDGDFNVGVQSHTELVSIIEKQRKTGISLSTIGVGQGNFHDGTMEQLANKGNGNYFYLDSFQEARKVFGTKLAGTIETVAKDVKLQIEFNPEHVAEYRLIGYENRALENQDFANDKVDAGEIGVGHTVTALYEITFKDSTLEKNEESRYKEQAKGEVNISKDLKGELAFLKVRYKEPKGSVSKLLTFPILKSKIKLSTDLMTDFNFATAVYYFASLLKESKYVNGFDYSDVAKLAAQSLGEDSKGERREFLNLVNNLATPRN